MTLLDGQLDVLRIMVATTNNDQILEPPGHKKLVIVEKAEVAGSQKWTCAGIGQMRAKCLLRRFGLAPVPLRHAGTCHPNFAHFARRALLLCFGVGDDDLLVCQIPTAADERSAVLGARDTRTRPVLLQGSRCNRVK